MVMDQQNVSTPMQEWVAQALERMKPILDGHGFATYQVIDGQVSFDKDHIKDILDRVEWLAQHFKVMPEPSTARCEGSIALGKDCECLCWQAGGIAALTNVVERMEADEENGA